LHICPCRHRFSGKKKSHGWCDFAAASSILDSQLGFMTDDTVLVTAEILILKETVSYGRDGDLALTGSSNSAAAASLSDTNAGRFSWTIHNFSIFKDMVRAAAQCQLLYFSSAAKATGKCG
jgi:hypothetical protein